MGAICSLSCVDNQVHPEEKKIYWSMPSWCIENPKVDEFVVKLVKDSWTHVIEGNSEPFRKEQVKNPGLTSVVFFHDTFYNSFFKIAPAVRPYFKRGIKSQGQVLANLLTFIISCAENNDGQLVKLLKHVAVVHNQMRIIAPFYSIVGQVLCMTLRECLGDELFSNDVEHAWIVIYSFMMSVIIPVVVSGETTHTKDTYYENYGIALNNNVKKK